MIQVRHSVLYSGAPCLERLGDRRARVSPKVIRRRLPDHVFHVSPGRDPAFPARSIRFSASGRRNAADAVAERVAGYATSWLGSPGSTQRETPRTSPDPNKKPRCGNCRGRHRTRSLKKKDSVVALAVQTEDMAIPV